MHGLHYIGDKLALLQRASSWLTERGQLAANLDLRNLVIQGESRSTRTMAAELRRAGLEYDPRRKLVTCAGRPGNPIRAPVPRRRRPGRSKLHEPAGRRFLLPAHGLTDQPHSDVGRTERSVVPASQRLGLSARSVPERRRCAPWSGLRLLTFGPILLSRAGATGILPVPNGPSLAH